MVSSSAEGELAIDEISSTVILASNVYVEPQMFVAVREGKECVQELLDHLRGEESAACQVVSGGEIDEYDSFVGITEFGDLDSEGCTFGDALESANL